MEDDGGCDEGVGYFVVLLSVSLISLMKNRVRSTCMISQNFLRSNEGITRVLIPEKAGQWTKH